MKLARALAIAFSVLILGAFTKCAGPPDGYGWLTVGFPAQPPDSEQQIVLALVRSTDSEEYMMLGARTKSAAEFGPIPAADYMLVGYIEDPPSKSKHYRALLRSRIRINNHGRTHINLGVAGSRSVEITYPKAFENAPADKPVTLLFTSKPLDVAGGKISTKTAYDSNLETFVNIHVGEVIVFDKMAVQALHVEVVRGLTDGTEPSALKHIQLPAGQTGSSTSLVIGPNS